MELTDLTIKEVHQGLLSKNFSSLELTKSFLKRIEKLNPEIFAYLTLSQDLALAQAKKVDTLISQKKKISLLAGVPMAVKDNILVKDIKCTAASKILKDYVAPYSATVIKRLEGVGAVILGKTNLDEFAMGSSTENSAFGVTRNPFDLSRVPGGSSGGSAAAVAAKMAVYSLGSETGGSIRLPASFCGIVGLKPTYGAVSRYGLIALASSLDQIGPMTKTVEDAKIVFEAIMGRDPLDSTSAEMIKTEKIKDQIEETIIGVPKEYFTQGLDPKIEKIIKTAIKRYEEMGAKIREVSLPHSKYALAVYYIINPSEASANLARYDGVNFGFHREMFGQEVKRRILLGTYVLSAGHYEAYYLKAQKVLSLIKNDFEKAFKQADFLMSPVSPFLPFKIGEKVNDPLSMYLNDIYNVSVNLAGLPALSLPIGQVDGLPVGLQIIGKRFEEDRIFQIANIYDNR